MRKNVGTTDRILRVTFGVVFLAVGILRTFGSIWSALFSVLGAEVLLVALIGYSPVYDLLGYSSVRPNIAVKGEADKWTTGVPDEEVD